MKQSYTYTCPEGHPFMSYAPDVGEEVRCPHVRRVPEGEPRPKPCGELMVILDG